MNHATSCSYLSPRLHRSARGGCGCGVQYSQPWGCRRVCDAFFPVVFRMQAVYLAGLVGCIPFRYTQ